MGLVKKIGGYQDKYYAEWYASLRVEVKNERRFSRKT